MELASVPPRLCASAVSFATSSTRATAALLMHWTAIMSVDRSRLHIAVQRSGRLSDASRELLREAGLRLQSGKNSLSASAGNFPSDRLFLHADHAPPSAPPFASL